MRRHRNWQELAEGDRKVVEGKRRRQKPVGLLSDPMGVSLSQALATTLATAIKADRV